MSIYNNELAYLMKFHGIKAVPIYEGSGYRGKIVLEGDALKYEHKDCTYYIYVEYALKEALKQFNGVVGAFKKFNDNAPLDTIALYTVNCWGRPKSVTEERWSGSINEVMERLYKQNMRLTYCNGHSYSFKEPEVDMLYRLWLQWIDQREESINLYIRNGGDMW